MKRIERGGKGISPIEVGEKMKRDGEKRLIGMLYVRRRAWCRVVNGAKGVGREGWKRVDENKERKKGRVDHGASRLKRGG